MPKPILVIIGRPNVGKSTLFNRIAGRRAAIVEDVPGVTRDRNYIDARWEGKDFIVVDTGGFYPSHEDDIFRQIKEQALFAIDEADIIIHLLDAKEGINPHDFDIANILRASGKEVIWAVNKIDGPNSEDKLYEFYTLGVNDPIGISAMNGYNFDQMMDRVSDMLPSTVYEQAQYPMIAVVGRPNVGKSTLVNALLGKDRMLVSPASGTTRDSIDSMCSYYKKKYILIDTAGIRRKNSHGYSIERFAVIRAIRSIQRADIVLLMMDSSEGIVADDVKIAGLVHKYGKPAIFVFNKWDMSTEPVKDLKKLQTSIERKLWFFSHAPVLTTSAVSKKRITSVFPIIDRTLQESCKRISTAGLNKLASSIRLPAFKGKQVKIYYMTQTSVSPPVFVVFANKPDAFKTPTIRHIEASIRLAHSYSGVPIRVVVRGKS